MGRGIRRDHEKNSTPYEETVPPVQEQVTMLQPGEELFQCIDCFHSFTLKQTERDWFLSKSLTLPKRCKECRAKRRQMNALPQARPGQEVVR
jgi:hypothetical protein